MKPAPFDYIRAESAVHASALLVEDENGRIIAGGQTLVPMLAMRLARPSRLIDVARIQELSYIRDDGEMISIGATTRQVLVEKSALIAQKLPLLHKAIEWVGHPPTRARGTVGGSLANSDPAAEIALVAATLGATLRYVDETGENSVEVDDYFIGPMITALPQTACLIGADFPKWAEPFVGTGFEEVNARSSDFAFVSAASQVAVDPDGTCTRAVLGIGGLGDFPFRVDIDAVRDRIGNESALREAIGAAIDDVEPLADLHATAEYRQRVAVTLGCRSLLNAVREAKELAHAN
jgi:CO/xanthine dehydrogenase FAD-binding subunit